jgi:hypothetical protein
MANKFARSNGDFNNSSIWSGLAASMSATSVPTIGDNAIANTYTIQITGNVACDNITNGTAYGGTGGGRFVVSNSTNTIDVSANATSSSFGTFTTYTAHACLSVVSPQLVNIYGNLINGEVNAANHIVVVNNNNVVNIYGNLDFSVAGSNQGGVPVYISNAQQVNVYGNINGGRNNSSADNGNHSGLINTSNSASVFVYGNVSGGISDAGIRNTSAGTVTINGNLIATTQRPAVLNTSTGSVTVYGNLNGSSGLALSNTSTGSVTAYGNLNGGSASALSNTSTGSVTVLGNVISDSQGGNGIVSTNAAANVKISGNLIGAPNGIPAVYAASYTINPVLYETYIRYANNGTGVGSDAYLYHYTTDSLSAFSMPPVSSVRAGVQYADNTLTGTCEIPPVSSVAFGAPVDNTTGTAAVTSNALFDVLFASLTATNSVGARLKNSATIESVGRIITSFSN